MIRLPLKTGQPDGNSQHGISESSVKRLIREHGAQLKFHPVVASADPSAALLRVRFRRGKHTDAGVSTGLWHMSRDRRGFSKSACDADIVISFQQRAIGVLHPHRTRRPRGHVLQARNAVVP